MRDFFQGNFPANGEVNHVRLWSGHAVFIPLLALALLWALCLLKRRSRQLRSEVIRRQTAEQALARCLSDERQRITRELHDGIGSQLTGLALLASRLQTILSREFSPHADEAAELASTLPLVVSSFRTLVHGLAPLESRLPESDANHLTSRLMHLAKETEKRSGVACNLEYDPEIPPVSATTAQQLCLIAREAVTNALKHASASKICLSLTQVQNHLKLQITDNGVGLPGRSARGSGLGLRNLKARAAQLGATLTIESELGDGTTVCCLWNRKDANGSTRATIENSYS